LVDKKTKLTDLIINTDPEQTNPKQPTNLYPTTNTDPKQPTNNNSPINNNSPTDTEEDTEEYNWIREKVKLISINTQ